MKTLHIEYPETFPDASGQAAEIAGVSRYAFLHELSHYRVNAIDWDPSEFEAEVES